MQTLGLLGLVAGALLLTALSSPTIGRALGPGFSAARVYDRVFEVLLAAGVVLAWRRLELGGASAIGLVRRRWARGLGRGALAGMTGLAVGLGACWLAGALVPALRFPVGKTVRKALLGAGAATAIGVGEEILFRGVLLRRLRIDLGEIAGVAATTALYAAVHVLRGGGGRRTAGPWAGVDRTLALFAPLGNPDVVPVLAGLAGLGLLLAVVRLRTGSLWPAIGIHAAWVAVFRVGRLFFDLRHTPAWLVGWGWPPLVGGAAGWCALAVTAWLILRPNSRL